MDLTASMVDDVSAVVVSVDVHCATQLGQEPNNEPDPEPCVCHQQRLSAHNHNIQTISRVHHTRQRKSVTSKSLLDCSRLHRRPQRIVVPTSTPSYQRPHLRTNVAYRRTIHELGRVRGTSECQDVDTSRLFCVVTDIQSSSSEVASKLI